MLTSFCSDSLELGWQSYPAYSLARAIEMGDSCSRYDRVSVDYADWQGGRGADVDLDYDEPCAGSSCSWLGSQTFLRGWVRIALDLVCLV